MKLTYHTLLTLVFVPVVLVLTSTVLLKADETTPTADHVESKYEQARALYSEGPSKAQEIIQLLKEELEEHPDNEKAIKLLGITYFGIGNSEAALVQFDSAISLAAKEDRILPHMIFYKARALHDLARDEEAKQLLEAYWAFFQDDEKLTRQYDILYPAVNESLKAKSPSADSTQPEKK